MLRTIQGIRCRVLSPSIYEVLDTNEVVQRQTVCFTGERWCLHTKLLYGPGFLVAFASRDAALQHLARRRHDAEALM